MPFTPKLVESRESNFHFEKFKVCHATIFKFPKLQMSVSKGGTNYLSTGIYRPVLDIPVSPDISARMTAGIVINRYCISYYKCIQNAPNPLKCLLKLTWRSFV